MLCEQTVLNIPLLMLSYFYTDASGCDMEVVLCVKGAGKELPVGFDQSNFHKQNEIMLSLSKNI